MFNSIRPFMRSILGSSKRQKLSLLFVLCLSALSAQADWWQDAQSSFQEFLRQHTTIRPSRGTEGETTITPAPVEDPLAIARARVRARDILAFPDYQSQSSCLQFDPIQQRCLRNSPSWQKSYFQLFPNYFPIPNKSMSPSVRDNVSTRIQSRYKLHPTGEIRQSLAYEMDENDERVLDSNNQPIPRVEDQNGNEYLYVYSCASVDSLMDRERVSAEQEQQLTIAESQEENVCRKIAVNYQSFENYIFNRVKARIRVRENRSITTTDATEPIDVMAAEIMRQRQATPGTETVQQVDRMIRQMAQQRGRSVQNRCSRFQSQDTTADGSFANYVTDAVRIMQNRRATLSNTLDQISRPLIRRAGLIPGVDIDLPIRICRTENHRRTDRCTDIPTIGALKIPISYYEAGVADRIRDYRDEVADIDQQLLFIDSLYNNASLDRLTIYRQRRGYNGSYEVRQTSRREAINHLRRVLRANAGTLTFFDTLTLLRTGLQSEIARFRAEARRLTDTPRRTTVLGFIPMEERDVDAIRQWNFKAEKYEEVLGWLNAIELTYNAHLFTIMNGIETLRTQISAARAAEQRRSRTYDTAFATCNGSLQMIPIPIGTVVGVASQRQTTTGSDYRLNVLRHLRMPSRSVTDSSGRPVMLNLVEVELVYFPPSTLPAADVAQILRQENRTNREEIRRTIRDQTINYLFNFFKPGGQNTSGGSTQMDPSIRPRFFVETNLFNNNATSNQAVDIFRPTKSFNIRTYTDFIRSIGANGFFMIPDAQNSSFLVPRVIDTEGVNKLVQQDQTAVLNELSVPTGIKNLQWEPMTAPTSRSSLLPPAKFLAHSNYMHVDWSTKFAMIRRQIRPVTQSDGGRGMCFQYYKEALLLANLVTSYPIGSAARLVEESLDRFTWQDDPTISPPLSQRYYSPRPDATATATGVSADNALLQELGDIQGFDKFENNLENLQQYCVRVMGSLGVSEADPLTRDICFGVRMGNRTGALTALREEVRSNTRLSEEPFRTWIQTNPYIECLAPYGAHMGFDAVCNGSDGHIEIKTEGIGKCGFVSDHFDTRPINRTSLGDCRELKRVMLINTN